MAIVVSDKLRFYICLALTVQSRKIRMTDLLFYILTRDDDEETFDRLGSQLCIRKANYHFAYRDFKRYMSVPIEEIIDQVVAYRKSAKSKPPFVKENVDLDDIIASFL